jgi:nitrite reductase/ring-hydroxylating ferredoxin subunit
LVAASAYLGGELSYSQKIGVNHAPDPEGELPEDYTEAINESELIEGKPAKVTIQGTDFLILKSGGQTYAMADKCSHLSGPLSEGRVEGDSIVCPWHGSKFCLKDGHVEDGPATNDQPVLDVKIENGKVLVKARQK